MGPYRKIKKALAPKPKPAAEKNPAPAAPPKEEKK
jgi:hypothetical protein